MKLTTTCERILFAGYFGIDEIGTQPECGCVVEIEIEDKDVEECIEYDGDNIRPSFSVECPKCKTMLEWPQVWEKSNPTLSGGSEVNNNNKETE